MLLTVKVPIAALEDDLRLIRQELAQEEPVPYIPEGFIRLVLEAMRVLRADDSLKIEPLAARDVLWLSRSKACEQRQPVVRLGDVLAATQDVVCRNAPDLAEAKLKVADAFPEARSYLCRWLSGVDIANLCQGLQNHLRHRMCTAATIRQCILSGQDPPELAVLTAWIAQHETMRYYQIHDVIAAYLEVLLMPTSKCSCMKET